MAERNKVYLGDGEDIDVDSLEEANDILEEHEPDGSREITFETYVVDGEHVATVPEMNPEYVGRGRCEWEAIDDLARLVDARAHHFTAGHDHPIAPEE